MITLQTDPSATEGWYQIEAYGEHTKTLEDGTEIIEVIDEQTAQSVCGQTMPPAGILIDRDHLSRDNGNSTEAMGWLKKLEAIEGGIAGYIEWTTIGQSLKGGKVYQHFSTEYAMPDIINGKVYPRTLVGLALTNRPNNEQGQRPISNRKSCDLKNKQNQQTETDNTMTEEEMKAIALLLGLPEDATAAQITAEIQALTERTAVAEEAEAEAILNSEDTDDMSEDEKELMKEELIKNRSRAMKILANRRRSPRTQTPSAPARKYNGVIKNRGGVMGTPSHKAAAESVRDRAYEIQRNTGCSYFEALRLANK